MKNKTPLLLVVMGVSGCGKSTLAKAISVALNLRMLDGDDLHSTQSIVKMQAGIALDDADRWPWLDRIANYLASGAIQDNSEPGRVIACSALKRSYRDRIRKPLAGLRFIFLDGDDALIRSRMAARTGHFMQLELLDSQLHTLERPGADETDVISLNMMYSVDNLVAQTIAALQTLATQQPPSDGRTNVHLAKPANGLNVFANGKTALLSAPATTQ